MNDLLNLRRLASNKKSWRCCLPIVPWSSTVQKQKHRKNRFRSGTTVAPHNRFTLLETLFQILRRQLCARPVGWSMLDAHFSETIGTLTPDQQTSRCYAHNKYSTPPAYFVSWCRCIMCDIHISVRFWIWVCDAVVVVDSWHHRTTRRLSCGIISYFRRRVFLIILH